jgi:cytochrome c
LWLLTLALVAIPISAAADPGAAAFSHYCGTCHVVSADGGPRQGPNLHGVVGRPAGSLSGFAYSPALQNAKLTGAFIPGSVMNMRLQDPTVRQAIIAFLRQSDK